MSRGPEVVLLNADPEALARWAALFAGTARLRTATSVEELAVQLVLEPAAVLVAPCDAGLLDGIQHCRGEARLVLCGPVLPLGVIDAAGQGYDLRHVERESQLKREVHALARPRSLTVRHQLPGLSLSWSGALRPAPLLELSNGGFSFRLELDEELERLLPDALLESLEIHRGPALGLTAESAVVRYVEQVDEPGATPHYRIGCELLPATVAAPASRALRVTEGAARAGLLRAALRSGGIFLQGLGPDSSGVLAPSGHVDLEKAELLLDAPPLSFEPCEVVRGSFELGGGAYSFVTAVMSVASEPTRSEQLLLRLPPLIEAAHRRSSARYAPSAQQPITAELSSPLLAGGSVRRAVLELSSTGFSFAVDGGVDLFPPGMRLSRIELTLGDLQLQCAGVVKNLAPLSGDGRSFRCGVVFDGLSEDARTQLADAVMRNRYPGLEDGSALSFEGLWKFFMDTRFLYPEKAAALEPSLPEVRRTFEKLNARRSKVFKSLLFSEGGQTLAHGSCVRVYRRTWLLQHLAGTTRRHGRQAPQVLNTGLAEYFGQTTDFEYCKFYFRPNNKWPSRVFGGFARKVTDRRLSDLRTFDYAAVPTSCILPATPHLRVLPASAQDLGLIERHFVKEERGLLLRSDDLTRASLELDELDGFYLPLGLSRRRAVLMALRGDEPVGFALCELSPPGLNLSELLSAFRIYLFAEGRSDGAAIRAALSRAALELYRKAGRSFCVALSEAAPAAALPEQSAGPAILLPALSRKQYVCWTVHRTLYQRFCEHVDRVYELLNSNRRKRERGADDVSDGEFVRGDAA